MSVCCVKVAARAAFAALWLAAGGYLWAEEPAVPEPAARAAVPTAEKLTAAEKGIRDIYKAEYAKSDPAARAALAKELLKQGEAMKDDLAACFVLLREARDLAAAARDFPTALDAHRALGERFAADEGELVLNGFLALTRQAFTPESAEQVLPGALEFLDQLEKDGRYDSLPKLWPAFEGLARYAKGGVSPAEIAERLRKSRAQYTEWLRLKPSLERLKAKPDDPEANYAAGSFYAVFRRDWERGLPLWVKGSNPNLKAAAEKDLAHPEDTAGKLAAGDAWWEAAEKEAPALKPALQARAAHWYGLVVGELTGLKKAVIEKRMQTASMAGFGPRVVPLTYKPGLIREIKLTRPAEASGFVHMLGASRLAVVELNAPARGENDFAVCDLEKGEQVRLVAGKLHSADHAVSPDGQRLLVVGRSVTPLPTGERDPAIYSTVMDLLTGAVSPPRKLDLHRCTGCTFSHDGQAVVYGFFGNGTRLLNVADGKDLAAGLKLPVVEAVHYFSERQQVMTVSKEELATYNLKTGKKERAVKLETRAGLPPAFHLLDVSPDRRLGLVSDNGAGQWSVLDLNDGRWVMSVSEPAYPAFWHADSRHVACARGNARTWELPSGRMSQDLWKGAWSLDFSVDGRFVLCLTGPVLQLHGLPKAMWVAQP